MLQNAGSSLALNAPAYMNIDSDLRAYFQEKVVEFFLCAGMNISIEV